MLCRKDMETIESALCHPRYYIYIDIDLSILFISFLAPSGGFGRSASLPTNVFSFGFQGKI